MVALVFGGVGVVLFLIGIVGWINEFFSKGHEEGLGTPAMMFFIISEVVIFGTMFAGFYMARVTHADVWSQWVPKGMNLHNTPYPDLDTMDIECDDSRS